MRKEDGALVWEKINGIPRIVIYIGYPGNYGMIPNTIFSKADGGDGDPLDALILGPPVPRGSIVNVKVIGVMEMLDNGETDHKLICVSKNTHFYSLGSMNDLTTNYPGITEILKIWFLNYKGPGVISDIQIKSVDSAMSLLQNSLIDK